MTLPFRRFVKWLLRPFAAPVLSRIDRRVTPLRDEVEALTKHVNALVDTIAAESTAVEEARSDLVRLESDLRRDQYRLEGELGALRSRVEFTRNELMYEVRYGGKGPGGNARAAAEPRIVAANRVPPHGEIRLNLGCGHIPLPDFLNVDTRDLAHVDVIADVRRLPFTEGSVAQIHSAHLLEHFAVEELRRSLLPYWVSLLRADGVLTAIVPDAETMIAEYAAGRLTFEDLRLVTYGQQEYDHDFHFNMFSQASLRELLLEAGLRDVRIVASGRRNGLCYEMEIEGRRPGTGAPEPKTADASSAR